MATNGEKSKTITYRRCIFGPKNDQNLQQLISAALSNLQTANQRMEPLDAQSTEIRIIGEQKTIDKMLCGYLSIYERGKWQAVITDDPNATNLSLSAIPPISKNGKKNEYIPGVLYFSIFENHVAIIQTTSLRGSALESHFSWLLKSKSSCLPPTTSMVLSDEAQKATKERIRKSHVKSIAFGQPLMSELNPIQPSTDHGASETSKKVEKKTRFQPSGPVFDLLKQIFDENKFEKLGLNEIFDGNLEVWIELRYPKYQRSHAENTIKLMDNLGIGLRDVEGDSISLQLADGNTVSGNDLKISGSIGVAVNSNGMLDKDVVWQGMVGWLKNQITNGVVDPD